MGDSGPGTAADPTRALAAFALYRSTGASAWIEVSGWSMRPLIRAGDEVHVEFGDRRPRIGEIVVFAEGDEMVVHRVVRRRRSAGVETLLTRGDGTRIFDRPFPAGEAFGIVRSCRRPGRDEPVAIAAGGVPAAVLARVSALAGRLLVLGDRLPPRLAGPSGRIVLGLVGRAARAAARLSSPGRSLSG